MEGASQACHKSLNQQLVIVEGDADAVVVVAAEVVVVAVVFWVGFQLGLVGRRAF